jgi:hypothetical protein
MGVTANAAGAISHVDIDNTIETANVMKVRISMVKEVNVGRVRRGVRIENAVPTPKA